jgi:hypothetical protein
MSLVAGYIGRVVRQNALVDGLGNHTLIILNANMLIGFGAKLTQKP